MGWVWDVLLKMEGALVSGKRRNGRQTTNVMWIILISANITFICEINFRESIW